MKMLDKPFYASKVQVVKILCFRYALGVLFYLPILLYLAEEKPILIVINLGMMLGIFVFDVLLSLREKKRWVCTLAAQHLMLSRSGYKSYPPQSPKTEMDMDWSGIERVSMRQSKILKLNYLQIFAKNAQNTQSDTQPEVNFLLYLLPPDEQKQIVQLIENRVENRVQAA